MSATPENPTNPPDHAATAAGGPPAGAAHPPSSGSPSAGGASAGPPPTAGFAAGVPRLPSLRMTAALAAVMLVLGVAVGAAIGPAPEGSLAGSRIPWLLPTLQALAGGSSQSHPAPAPAPAPQPLASAPTVPSAPTAATASTASRPASAAASSSSAGSSAASSSAPSAATTPTGTKAESEGKHATLPAITSVWLIQLAGASFTQALAQSASAPYMEAQLIPKGTLLSGWSAVEGSALASEVSLLTGAPPQTLDTIVQPPCPEGAAGAQCAPETAGALAAADSFLQQTVPAITSLAAYRERGLIVVTFGAVGSATASGLPAGAATATLSTTPPSGVLLLSPFARAGAKSSTAFNPASPKQSLEKLLHQ
jgi:hypothetical protein